MTNQEAVKIIKDYMTNDANHTLKIWFEALTLAIKALEKMDERSQLAEERADAIKAFEAEKKEGISLLRSLHLSEDDICEITNRVNMLDLAIKALKKANREEE